MIALLLATALLWALAIVALRAHPLISNRWSVGCVSLVIAGVVAVQVASAGSQADRALYVLEFRIQASSDTPWSARLFESDRAFSLFLWLLAKIAPPTEFVLYTTVCTLVILGFTVAARILLPPWATLAALVTVVAMGLVSAYASVAVRQGLAIACLLAAASLVALRRHNWEMVSLLAAASLFHWSAIPLAIGLAVLRFWTPAFRTQLATWLVLATAFVLGLPELFLGQAHWVPNLETYTAATTYAQYGSGGSRLKFLVFSAALMILAVWGRRQIPDDPVYERLCASYVVFNGAFLILGFIAFSDRLAAYSWFLAPLMLWYPLSHRDDGHSMLPVAGAVITLCGGLALGTIPALI